METVTRSWVLKRNCAMTPQQLLRAFIALGLLSLAVSAAWALAGAWVVIPFLLLEWGALAVAFWVYARHALDHERITLEGNKVCVEVVRGEHCEAQELPRAYLRCSPPDGRHALVRIQSRQEAVDVGRFVDQTGRRRFYEEFRAALLA